MGRLYTEQSPFGRDMISEPGGPQRTPSSGDRIEDLVEHIHLFDGPSHSH